jgi:hypothetical protein
MGHVRDDLIRLRDAAASNPKSEFGQGMAWAYNNVLELLDIADQKAPVTETTPFVPGDQVRGENAGKTDLGTIIRLARGGLREVPADKVLVEWSDGHTSWMRFEDLKSAADPAKR